MTSDLGLSARLQALSERKKIEVGVGAVLVISLFEVLIMVHAYGLLRRVELQRLAEA